VTVARVLVATRSERKGHNISITTSGNNNDYLRVMAMIGIDGKRTVMDIVICKQCHRQLSLNIDDVRNLLEM
jgi:hypothetical protein